MKRSWTLTFFLCLIAVPAVARAQNQAAAASAKSNEPSSDPLVAPLRFLYDYNQRNIMAAAEKMPAADYGFKPTTEIRSFGEILGHIADVHYLTCSAVKGEVNPQRQSIEKTARGKDEIITALKASFTYCDGVFANLTEATLKQMGKLGTDEQPKSTIVNLNVYHSGQHYGHLTVYLRLKGLTPPSTERAPQRPAPAVSAMPQFDLEAYQFGLLRRGPKWTAEKTAETERIQAEHLTHIGKMAAMGKLVAAGPMMDNGELRGIFIFRAASLDEARALAAEDPAIKAGRLTLELLPWWGPKGIGAKYAEERKRNPQAQDTMARHFLVLLSRGSKWTESATPENQKLQLDHLWNVRRMMDAGQMAAAGPFGGNTDWRGIFVLRAASPEEARAMVEADPAVKAGHLAVTIHPWFVAREVWP
jgi:uncharacterized protein YciI/uncharacterized damage-inducible protein DinB